jgi:hypothetical protein
VSHWKSIDGVLRGRLTLSSGYAQWPLVGALGASNSAGSTPSGFCDSWYTIDTVAWPSWPARRALTQVIPPLVVEVVNSPSSVRVPALRLDSDHSTTSRTCSEPSS